MECRKRKRAVRWFAVCLFCNFTDLFVASLELSYSVSEELQPGAFVGNIVKDLGLDVRSISKRNLRVVSDSNAQYFDVNSATGALVIKKTIDRERTCELSSTCSLHFQIVLENPIDINRVVVEITDVNDNAPQFPSKNISLEMSEAAAPGTTFRLQSAQDLDVGLNSLRTYFLSPNDCFILKVETKSDGSKFPELVLEKALDREKQGEFRLLLTAVDGGKPEKSAKAPNTDWRFSQNQRPGPSGAGVPPEGAVGTGPWPNPPTEAEQLQALMAAANEVSEATATLGPGTMGLSTRYSPQFTLQHVPDYRQNVYIPGSTATLTANPQQQALPPPQAQAPPPTQAEAPKAAQTPASKKKSAKKEKK